MTSSILRFLPPATPTIIRSKLSVSPVVGIKIVLKHIQTVDPAEDELNSIFGA